jgi:hypothetical protein
MEIFGFLIKNSFVDVDVDGLFLCLQNDENSPQKKNIQLHH